VDPDKRRTTLDLLGGRFGSGGLRSGFGSGLCLAGRFGRGSGLGSSSLAGGLRLRRGGGLGRWGGSGLRSRGGGLGGGGGGGRGILLLRDFLARGRSSGGQSGLTLVLGLLESFSQQSVVLLSGLLVRLVSLTTNSDQVALALQALRGNQSLDLGGLEVRLLLALNDLSSDDELLHIIISLQVEELANARRTLGTEAARLDGVGQTRDLTLTLLYDEKVENGELTRNNTATNGLSLALTTLAGSVEGVTLGEEETHTLGGQDTLLHGETFLVVTACDLEHIALELVTERLTLNFV